MKRKGFITSVTAIIVTMAISMTAYAINWDRLPIVTKFKYEDGEYKYLNTYKSEDGTEVRNQWVRMNDNMGVNVWMYFGEDGYALTDTITPDGYTVNERGIWYKNSPGAIIVEVDSYNPDNAYYPFSYDGEILKNDHLGVTCKYNAEDAAAGYSLNIYDSQGSMNYAVLNIEAPKDVTIQADVTRITDIDGYNNIILEAEHSRGREAEVCSITIAGKEMKGTRIKNYLGNQEYKLFALNNDGTSMLFTLSMPSEEQLSEVVNWMNIHFSF